MGLRKLQESFITERVNGEILLECDDEVLYQELKVWYYFILVLCRSLDSPANTQV